MKRAPFQSASPARQRGYVLLVILLMLALLMIGMLAVAPRITTQIKRDREKEMIERGQQYAIAVKRYYKKFGRYPVKLEDLESTNNMRFLRRAYKNPTDPKGEWRLLHFGEVKTVLKLPGAAGGQAAGVPAAALGGMAAPQASPIGQPIAGQPGQPAAGTTTGGPKVFGGGPIVGVAGTVDKGSIIAWHEKTNYKDWEFFYDPRLDTSAAAGGAVPGAVPAGAQGAQQGLTGATPNPMTSPMQPNPMQPPPQPPDQGPR